MRSYLQGIVILLFLTISDDVDKDRMSLYELTKKANELNNDNFVPTSVLDEVKVRASAAEKKSAHLSSLLSESESENVRLNQLSAVLKVN